MKVVFVMLALLASISYAQQDTTKDGRVIISSEAEKDPYHPQTLLKNKLRHGFMVGLEGGYGRANNKDAALMGLRAAWIINHKFAIGIAGYGTANNLSGSWTFNSEDTARYSGIGYGGFTFEPILFPESLIHVTFPVLVGAGAAWHTEELPGAFRESDDFRQRRLRSQTDGYAFFVVEPAVNVEMNVTKFFRLGVFGKYRLVGALADNPRFTNNSLSDYTAGLTLKFGKF